jgi:hypothetical protein
MAPQTTTAVGLPLVDAVANEVIAMGLPQRRRLSHGAAARCDLERVDQVLNRMLPASTAPADQRAEVRSSVIRRLVVSRDRRVSAARAAAAGRRVRGWRCG